VHNNYIAKNQRSIVGMISSRIAKQLQSLSRQVDSMNEEITIESKEYV